jgi:RimJ/RimL family protein N-acetyltransferase
MSSSSGMETSSGCLELRQLYVDDLSLVLAWRSDLDIIKYMPSAKRHPTMLEIHKGFLDRGVLRFAAVLRVPFAHVIGVSHLNIVTGEIGILIGEKSLWGAHLGHALLTLTLKNIRENKRANLSFPLPGVNAHIHPENIGSQRVFEAHGFRKTGPGRNGQDWWYLSDSGLLAI